MWWSRSVPLSTAPQSSVCVTRKVHVRDLEPTTRGKAVLRLFAGCDIYFRFRFFLLLGQARNSAASQRPESRRSSHNCPLYVALAALLYAREQHSS